jgi:hypothetical protein
MNDICKAVVEIVNGQWRVGQVCDVFQNVYHITVVFVMVVDGSNHCWILEPLGHRVDEFGDGQ